MKIVSITAVKNEADIIESFVRYHLNILDLMIILDNGSTDETNSILTKLIEEGLSVVVLKDTDKYFEPREKYNMLLKKAINEYCADIICTLDVDEFLTCDSKNPREIIENMDPFSYFIVKWRTYVPLNIDKDTKFIPSKLVHIRDEEIETFYKVILTKELYNNYRVQLVTGNHDLFISDRFKNKITCVEMNDLRIAHFPLRSVEQTMSKVLVSYPNTLSRKVVRPNVSHHYPLMFNKIKKEGKLDINDVTEFSKQYSLEENSGKLELEERNIKIIYHPMNLSFCKDIEIKYHFKINPLANVLENYLYFASEIHKFRSEYEN